MNLHQVVAPLIGAVNPNQIVSIRSSIGNVTGADGSSTPGYATPGSITAAIGGTFTASVPDPTNPTTLNVSAVLTGSLQIGDAVSGTDGSGNAIPDDTTILAQLSGTPGGVGTYELSAGATLASCTVTAASTILNVSAVAGGLLQPGQTLSDPNAGSCTASVADTASTVLVVSEINSGTIKIGDTVAAFDGTNALNAVISSQISGTPGGIGSYQLTAGPDNGLLNSTTVSFNLLLAGTQIASQVSGPTGGAGLYAITQQQTVPSEAMTTSVSVYAQIQPLAASDLRHVDMLNLQGTHRAMYVTGSVRGIIRVGLKGGDVVVLPDGSVWLVQQPLENYFETAGWTKVLITLQDGS